MAPLLQFLCLFALFSLSFSEGKGGPRDSVCKSDNKGLIPQKGHGKEKDHGKEYNVTIILIKEKDNQTVDCVENNERYIGT